MPNRILKESICYSEDIDKMKPDEEVFFYRLIVNCDDFGRMDARLPVLKARLYPLREQMKSSDIKRYLDRLSTSNPEPMILLYENAGVPYIQVAKWEKHQQVRAKRSKYPGINDDGSNMISDDIRRNQVKSNDSICPRNPIQSNPNPNPNPNPTPHPKADADACEKLFEDCWMAYPKKIGKNAVTKKAKAELVKIGADRMKTAITAYVTDYESRPGHTDDSYMKNGSTWFNGGYIDWLDYKPPEGQQDINDIVNEMIEKERRDRDEQRRIGQDAQVHDVCIPDDHES